MSTEIAAIFQMSCYVVLLNISTNMSCVIANSIAD
jgi:hypothetical protein